MIDVESVEAFKQFIQTLPNINQAVHEGRYTWQELYENYVLYGADDKFWQEFKVPENKGLELNGLVNMLRDIDLDAMMNSMQSLEKILGIAAAFFDQPTDNHQQYEEYDD